MITLFGFGKNLGIIDPSPYVLKVDVYMKMAGIEFERVNNFDDFKKAPKGKLPYLRDGEQIIADSFFILKYLNKRYDVTLDAHLSDEQKAISHLIIRSLDENFYWCLIWSRWIQDDTWPAIKAAFFGALPLPLKHVVPFILRRGVKSAFLKQGMGRHNDVEVLQIAEDTLENLSQMLADKPYFWGDSPSSLDAVAYAFLAEVIEVELDNSLNRLARKYENLVNFCRRVNQKYYANDQH